MKVLRIRKIKRKYLRIAAIYRRASGLADADFSVNALKAAYMFESTGAVGDMTTRQGFHVMPTGKFNGYLHGKWALDITVSQVLEDIRRGDFCKFEFTRGPRGWFWKSVLVGVQQGRPFFFREEIAAGIAA